MYDTYADAYSISLVLRSQQTRNFFILKLYFQCTVSIDPNLIFSAKFMINWALFGFLFSFDFELAQQNRQ